MLILSIMTSACEISSTPDIEPRVIPTVPPEGSQPAIDQPDALEPGPVGPFDPENPDDWIQLIDHWRPGNSGLNAELVVRAVIGAGRSPLLARRRLGRSYSAAQASQPRAAWVFVPPLRGWKVEGLSLTSAPC
jgi:hypothetical protein